MFPFYVWNSRCKLNEKPRDLPVRPRVDRTEVWSWRSRNCNPENTPQRTCLRTIRCTWIIAAKTFLSRNDALTKNSSRQAHTHNENRKQINMDEAVAWTVPLRSLRFKDYTAKATYHRIENSSRASVMVKEGRFEYVSRLSKKWSTVTMMFIWSGASFPKGVSVWTVQPFHPTLLEAIRTVLEEDEEEEDREDENLLPLFFSLFLRFSFLFSFFFRADAFRIS